MGAYLINRSKKNNTEINSKETYTYLEKSVGLLKPTWAERKPSMLKTPVFCGTILNNTVEINRKMLISAELCSY